MPITSFSEFNKGTDDGDDEGGYNIGEGGEGRPKSFADYVYRKRESTTAPSTSSKNSNETYIFHEVQESALCGQHCLNNLLQSDVFAAEDLAEIAQELDRMEASIGALGGESANVDAAGNFSVQVLRKALQSSYGIELELIQNTSILDAEHEDGLIINRNEHWLAFRRIGGKWYNLNSTLTRPEPVNTLVLISTVENYKMEGYSIFAPTRGLLPEAGRLPQDYNQEDDGCYWLKESDLYGSDPFAPGAKTGTAAAEAKVDPFAGKGVRLGGDPEWNCEACTFLNQPEVGACDMCGTPKSVVVALAETTTDARPKSDKEVAREKRLAALAARGL